MTQIVPFDPVAEARRQWASHWGDEATPAMEAVASIMRTQQILMGRLNLLLKPFELTFPRYEALMLIYLSRRGAMALGKIGERLQVHPTSVTSVIDGLERTGHIRRIPHERDRRATLAEITESGRAVAEAATVAINEGRFGTEPFEPADLEAISAALRPFRAANDGFESENAL